MATVLHEPFQRIDVIVKRDTDRWKMLSSHFYAETQYNVVVEAMRFNMSQTRNNHVTMFGYKLQMGLVVGTVATTQCVSLFRDRVVLPTILFLTCLNAVNC